MSKLTIVPTPIGNLEDITLRAISVLSQVDVVLAEDTRTTRFLLKHLQIDKPIWSHHKFNEHAAVASVIETIQGGRSVALVSDAGTPGISDPGFLLIRHALEAGITVESLPGPTAFVPALLNSGFPCDRFCFEGFLPVKKGREKRIKALASEERTMILYESPHRLVKLLTQLSEHISPLREASVSRELTKKFEENRRGTLTELIDYFSAREVKGEIVVVLKGYTKGEAELRSSEKEITNNEE